MAQNQEGCEESESGEGEQRHGQRRVEVRAQMEDCGAPKLLTLSMTFWRAYQYPSAFSAASLHVPVLLPFPYPRSYRSSSLELCKCCTRSCSYSCSFTSDFYSQLRLPPLIIIVVTIIVIFIIGYRPFNSHSFAHASKTTNVFFPVFLAPDKRKVVI